MIINETGLTEKNIGKFRSKFMWRSQIFTLILCLIVIGCGGVELYYGDIGFGVFCIVFGTVFFPLILVMQHFATKKNIKSMQLEGNVVNKYYFDENNVNVETYRGETKVGQSLVAYENVYKVEEHDTSYYIYVSNVQAFIVDKDKFTQGNSADLTILLATKLGPKYQVKLSKKQREANMKGNK